MSSSAAAVPDTASRNVVVSYFVWLLATRTAKLLPHLWYRPQDIIHIPAFILFGYYFAVMKLYALVTLHEVSLMSTNRLFVADVFILDWMGHPRRYRRPDRCHCRGGRW